LSYIFKQLVNDKILSILNIVDSKRKEINNSKIIAKRISNLLKTIHTNICYLEISVSSIK